MSNHSNYSTSPLLRRVHRRMEYILSQFAKIIMSNELCFILFIIEVNLIPFKIINYISCSWIWVFSPVWIYSILFIVMCLIQKQINKVSAMYDDNKSDICDMYISKDGNWIDIKKTND